MVALVSLPLLLQAQPTAHYVPGVEGLKGASLPPPSEDVAKAIVRGVAWSQPEVYIGIGESMISGWNDFAPWAVDLGVDLMRNRMMAAVGNQRTT